MKKFSLIISVFSTILEDLFKRGEEILSVVIKTVSGRKITVYKRVDKNTEIYNYDE